MARRAGLSPTAVVHAALAVIDESGTDALTLARVAGRTGVATPSLYKHVDGLPGLRRLVTRQVLDELTEVLRDAVLGRSGDDAMRALARAYRDYLRRHPRRFPFLEAVPDATDPEVSAAAERLTEVVFAVVRGYGLSGPALVHETRCLRAAIHGFAVVEAAGGFGLPEDIDVSFEHLLDMLALGIAARQESVTHQPERPQAARHDKERS